MHEPKIVHSQVLHSFSTSQGTTKMHLLEIFEIIIPQRFSNHVTFCLLESFGQGWNFIRFNATLDSRCSTFPWAAPKKWWADGTGSSLISQHNRTSKRRAGLSLWNEFLWEQLINTVPHRMKKAKRAACDTMVTFLSYTRSIFYAAVEDVSSDSGQNIPLKSLIWGRIFSLVGFFFF